MLDFEVAVDVQEDDVDPDLFEKQVIELAEGMHVAVTYDWGVTVFFEFKAKDILDAIARSLNVMSRTKYRVLGIEAGFAE